MSKEELKKLALIALGLVALPFVLQAAGLTYSTAVECAVLAMAGMALNLLLGYTGLVSFGHGAWFGIGAYAVGLIQLHYFREGVILPLLLAILLVAAISAVIGLLILLRRVVSLSFISLA